MMLLTERDTPEGLLVSVCDPDLIGRTFEDGPISLSVDSEFYEEGATQADADSVARSLGRAMTANLVGEKSVSVAIDHGFIDEVNVLDLGETVHAQYLRM